MASLARFPRPAALIAAAGFILALLLALDAIPFLRGGYGWQWQYIPAPLARAIPLFIVTAVYLAGAWTLLRRTARALPMLAWSALGIVALTLAVMALREDDLLRALTERTMSVITTGPHFAAAEIDWTGSGRSDWAQVMRDFDQWSGHVSVSPPGLPMFYALLNNLLGTLPDSTLQMMRAPLFGYQCHNYQFLAYSPAQWASAWFGILMPVWAALSVIPFYGVARRVTGQVWARRAALWWALVPALVAFSPSWSTFYPLASLSAFWLFDVGISRPSGWGWIAAAGALTGLMTFANFAFIPFVALFGFYTLARFLLVERPASPPASAKWTRPLIVGLAFGVGLAAPWVIYWLATGVTLFDIFTASMVIHVDIPRPYLPWVWLHLWDWVLWTGLPLMLLWWAGIVHWLRQRRQDASQPLLAIALALSIFVLDISGTARGESGRVWLVFTPFAVIAAGDGLRRLVSHDSPVGTRHVVSLQISWGMIALAQAAIMLALTVTLFVIGVPDLRPRPAPPGGLEVANGSGADFAGLFRLAGWDAASAENAITLRLNWQTEAPMTTPYWFSALLVSPDGAAMPEAEVWQPLQTNYPTSCWTPGEVVGDEITLPLPADAAPGDWWISLAAFGDETASERLTVTLPDGAQDDQTGLGPVRVLDE